MKPSKSSLGKDVLLVVFLIFLLIYTWIGTSKSSLSTSLPDIDLSDDSWSILVDVLSGLTIGVLGNLLTNLVSKNIRTLATLQKVDAFLERMIVSIKARISTAAHFWDAILNKIILFGSYVVLGIYRFIASLLRSLQNKFLAPRWYKNPNAIDPGLIEVSLAITAIVIAVPVLTDNQLVVNGWIRIISVAISTGVSLSLMELYAKQRGSRSFSILFSPFEDGPLFFLAWGVIVCTIFVVIAFMTSGG